MYRTLLSYAEIGTTPLPVTNDLARCAAECGWQDGTLSAQALDREYGVVLSGSARATGRLLLQFRGGRLRLPAEGDVFLVLREEWDQECRILVRAWPHFLKPEVTGFAPWERVFTRVVVAVAGT